MLERHLYETIPDAWKMLGKQCIPPPIPKPMPAPVATRRKSVLPPSGPIEHSPAAILASGRVITRRLSMIIEKTVESDEKCTADGRQEMATDSAKSNSKGKSLFSLSSTQNGVQSMLLFHFFNCFSIKKSHQISLFNLCRINMVYSYYFSCYTDDD